MDRLKDKVILVVEDDDDQRQIYIELLARLGAVPLGAHDCESALKLYERYKGTIDCILMDVGLPRVSGIEIYEAFSQDSEFVKPVIFMSGDPNEESCVNSPVVSIGKFLLKPFQKEDLIEAIASAA